MAGGPSRRTSALKLYAFTVVVPATRARDKGRLLSKYQRDRQWRDGELTVSEDRDAELRRIMRVARLVHGSRDIFLPLLDATLIEMRSGLWTLTGFERVPDDALGELVAYQQSWLVMPRLH
jgi:hypothetical protein